MPAGRKSSARFRAAPLVVASALLSSALLGLSATGTLSAFTAAITNQNTASTGGITMRESDGASTTCTSTPSGTTSCALNQYGAGFLSPNRPTNTTTVAFTDTGSMKPTSFTLNPSPCNQSGSGTATDLCAKITVGVTCQIGAAAASTVFAPGTLNAFYNNGATITVPTACVPDAASGTTANFTFTVTLTATTNEYQSLTATQPLTWTFTA